MTCPNLLAIVFKKQEISQQVVTIMQELAFEFSGVTSPDPHSGRERPPPVPNIQPGLWPNAGLKCWDTYLGPPQLFSRGCAPAHINS